MWQNLAKNRPFSGKECQKMKILTINIQLTALFRLKYLFWASPTANSGDLYYEGSIKHTHRMKS